MQQLNILPSINCNILDDKIQCQHFSLDKKSFVSEKNKNKIIELIENNGIDCSKISRHMETNKRYFLLYSFFGSNKLIKQPIMSLLFTSQKLSKFFKDNYKTVDFIKTISQNDCSDQWTTISALFPCENLMDVASRTQGDLL